VPLHIAILDRGESVKIAILGGTGDEGLGLAIRYAAAGEEIIIGSRSAERAETAAHQVREKVPFGHVSGLPNDAAAEAADMVFVSVPYGGLRDTITALAPLLSGKILVSLVVPLQFGKGGPHAVLVEEGSAAEQAQACAPDARVVGAFQNLSAHELMEPDKDLGCDVIVCSNDKEARQDVMALAEKLTGVRAVDGGPLACSRYVEDLTALLIRLNRTYKTQTGIRITNLTSAE
jgi:8-hydroxy-5-deazaflavin:NADPH oxidoreductase